MRQIWQCGKQNTLIACRFLVDLSVKPFYFLYSLFLFDLVFVFFYFIHFCFASLTPLLLPNALCSIETTKKTCLLCLFFSSFLVFCWTNRGMIITSEICHFEIEHNERKKRIKIEFKKFIIFSKMGRKKVWVRDRRKEKTK